MTDSLPLGVSCSVVSDSLQFMDCSPPGSSVCEILQARILEWVAISFSNAWKWKVKVNSLSRVRLLATPWTAAYQAPPSMGFSRQEYWSGVPSPSPDKRLYWITIQRGSIHMFSHKVGDHLWYWKFSYWKIMVQENWPNFLPVYPNNPY